MSDVFEAAAQSVIDGTASPEQTTESPSTEQAPQAAAAEPSKEALAAILELDKVDKFKFDGQEWTAKDLKAAILRQKDYTQKTQGLAKERESLESEKKFRENLAWDLLKLRDNPKLIEEFWQVYPKAYHSYAETFLKQSPSEPTETKVQNVPQVPIELLSDIKSLKEFRDEYKIRESEQAIEKTYAEFSEKYPETKSVLGHKQVMAMAFETNSKGQELTPDVWEQIFKTVHDELAEFKNSGIAEKKEAMKKQTEANQKARDVGPGGGMAGRAPTKFTKIDDLIKYGEQALKEGAIG